MGKFATIILTVVAVAILLLMTLSGVSQFRYNQENFRSENECIQHYIYQGVERKNIVRDNGVCYVKE